MASVDIPEVLDAIKRVREYMLKPDVDVVWSKYETVEDALREISEHIERLEAGDVSTIERLRVLFAPTGSFQELSLSNGWGDEFIEISSMFDNAIGETA